MGVSLAGSNPARSVLLKLVHLFSQPQCILSACREARARLAQSVEHQTFNLRVKGSSPLLGAVFTLTKEGPLEFCKPFLPLKPGQGSSVAQWKRAGPITQRSMDRNHSLLHFLFRQPPEGTLLNPIDAPLPNIP